MIKIILVSFLFILIAACSSNNQETNAFEEFRAERDGRREVRELVDQKREEYTAPLGEITFTGNPEELNNITLELNTGWVTAGVPRYYYFIEKEGSLELHVAIYVESDNDMYGMDYIEEELIVDDILFEDGTYTVYAEDYTFFLHMFTESIRRLRDDAGEALTPSHYIPPETENEWYREARDELNK